MENEEIYDLIIVGGGINGTGIAADAALRGLRVVLCEQQDLANATSSASTKLIHGGLRYLELYEFRLVKESLQEREILLENAKHLVKPQRFILPHQPTTRPFWEIRLGLFLYDHLARHQSLPKTKIINFEKESFDHILKPNFTRGFEYTDCKTDDARLVITNAIQAFRHGAKIMNYTECMQATRKPNFWEVTIKNQLTDEHATLKSKALINATGPWVEKFLQNRLQAQSRHHLKLVKGSHIIVPKFYSADKAFILQQPDKRVIFLIPYLDKFLLIGTTDVNYDGNLDKVSISDEEIDYLINAVNRYCYHQLKKTDIVHCYSGVRPLLNSKTDNPANVTRDYRIELDCDANHLPLISLFGGKLTTYRRLAEKVIDQLQPFFKGLPTSKTAQTALPGSSYLSDAVLQQEVAKKHAWLPWHLALRYLHQYGNDTLNLLADCTCFDDLGIDFGGGLHRKEVDYLVKHEWAKTAEDILWRRTKVGYFYPKENLDALKHYLKTQL